MKYWAMALMLVLCLGVVSFGQEAEVVVGEVTIDGGTGEVEAPVVDAQPIWVLILPALVAIIIAVLERAGKKDALKKLRGAMEVGRTVFAAIEEAGEKGPKKLVRRAIEAASTSAEAKEIAEVLHAVTDPKRAVDPNVAPLKRFWRRMLRGQNLAGVAAKIAVSGAIQGYLSKEE